MKAFVSLWSADLLRLEEAVHAIEAVADGIHLDVYDGHSVKELLFFPDLVVALRKITHLPIEAHLSVDEPDYWAERFVRAGADVIAVQNSGSPNIRKTLTLIRALGAKSSLGVELHEEPKDVVHLFDVCDHLLLLGTANGVKGVPHYKATPARVAALVEAREASGRSEHDLEIYVDGGIRDSTVEALAAAGADGVVPGSLVFGNPVPAEAIRALRTLGRVPVNS